MSIRHPAACVALTILLAGCGPDESSEQDDTTVLDSLADSNITEDTDTTQVESRAWYESAVMYEVFVRSFQDSDGDGIGDLRGLISRLDYLNDGVPGEGDDLEVDGIWLMPIFASPSYHGYDAVNYRAINPEYGTLADFDALLAACEARGIRVVLDLVMNHTSREHPWFVDARTGPTAAKRDHYVWRDDPPNWVQPFPPGDAVWHSNGDDAQYYGVFWEGMPDLNYREPAVLTEMTAIAEYWLARGVAGFRLDAVRYLVETEGDTGGQAGQAEQPETHAAWRAFRAALEVTYPDVYLVGEVWTGRDNYASYWGDGKELPQAFDFDLQGGLDQAVSKENAAWLTGALSRVAGSGVPWRYEATFLTNHDLDRVSRRLDDTGQRLAAVLWMTLPGTPYLYYGQELGMKMSAVPGDPAKRGPMAWDATHTAGFTTGTPWLALGPEHEARNVQTMGGDADSLLALYRRLIQLRRDHPTLTDVGLDVPRASTTSTLTLLRYDNASTYLVAANLGDTEVSEVVTDLSETPAQLDASAPLTLGDLLSGDRVEVIFGGDGAEATLSAPWPAGAVRVLKLR